MKLLPKIRYRNKITVVICAFTLLPCLILSIFIVKNLWDDRVGYILDENRSQLRIDTEAIDGLYSSGLQKLVYINTNNFILSYLDKGNFTDLLNNISTNFDIKTLIEALTGNYSKGRITIYPLDGSIYNGSYIERFERLKARLDRINTGYEPRLQQLGSDEYLWLYEGAGTGGANEDGSGYICCYKKMLSVEKTLAITEFRISIDEVMKSISGGYPPGSFIVYRPVNQDNYVAIKAVHQENSQYTPGTADQMEKLDSGGYYPISINLSNNSGIFTAYVPRSYISSQLRGFFWITVLGILIIIILLFVTIKTVSFFLTGRLSMLIDRINNDVGSRSKSKFHKFKHPADDDIGQLETKFYDMVNRLQDSYQKSLDYEKERKAYELELLQSRINPHFLYNTLSTLRWDCNNEKMENAIEAMVSYYRLVLSKGDTVVTVDHEMRLAEEYLKIQKYTYRSGFEYTVEVDEDVRNFPIVKNLLQPIVENAFLHGITGMKSLGAIKLSGRLIDSNITLTVEDNGLGMQEETVQKLLSGEYKGKMGGYGIINIQKRLQLFYGPDSTMSIISAPGKGTTVVISIPSGYQGSSGDKVFAVQ